MEIVPRYPSGMDGDAPPRLADALPRTDPATPGMVALINACEDYFAVDFLRAGIFARPPFPARRPAFGPACLN